MADEEIKVNSNTNNDKELDEMFAIYKQRIDEFAAILPEKKLPIPTRGKKTLIGSNNILHEKFKEKRHEIYDSMKNCYPLVHGSVLSLVYDFVSIKRKYGSDKEKQLYKNMKMHEFLDRLATKRCVIFFQRWDEFSTQKGYNSAGNYESIGSDKEDQRLSIKHCLTYDELMISALCGISSPTHFINNGNRANCGTVQQFDKRYPRTAYYIGLVGARFEKQNVMEHALMAVSEQQNTKEFGYGNDMDSTNTQNDNTESKQDIKQNDTEKNKEFASELMDLLNKNKNVTHNNAVWRAFEKYYNKKYFPLFSQVMEEYNKNKEKCNYVPNWSGNTFLDCNMFKQRIRVTLELFLFDADYRAKKRNEKDELHGAYCHIVGLGTGVWALNKQIQDTFIVEVTRDIIKENNLQHIDMVYFSWMYDKSLSNTMEKYKEDFEEDKENNNYCIYDLSGHKISVEQGKRNPCDILTGNYKQCLLVAMYAWDSNAFPGNEYYKGMLSASGDPAAASCSTISFVQNPMINNEYIHGNNSMLYFTDKKGQYECYKVKDIEFDKDPDKWLEKSRNSIPIYN